MFHKSILSNFAIFMYQIDVDEKNFKALNKGGEMCKYLCQAFSKAIPDHFPKFTFYLAKFYLHN